MGSANRQQAKCRAILRKGPVKHRCYRRFASFHSLRSNGKDNRSAAGKMVTTKGQSADWFVWRIMTSTQLEPVIARSSADVQPHLRVISVKVQEVREREMRYEKRPKGFNTALSPFATAKNVPAGFESLSHL